MAIELLIEPSRSGFVQSNAQEIRSCAGAPTSAAIVVFAVAGATVKRPAPVHGELCWFRNEKSKILLAGLADPVTPAEEIDAVVQKIPEK
jgi:hypothetical protein